MFAVMSGNSNASQDCYSLFQPKHDKANKMMCNQQRLISLGKRPDQLLSVWESAQTNQSPHGETSVP